MKVHTGAAVADTSRPTVSVVVITYARPQYLEQCLQHLAALALPPLEVIVVDASPDDRTHALLEDRFPDVRELRNDLGPGTMPESRDIGLRAAQGEIVAFIDDDAFVDEHWLTNLLAPFADAGVGGVGGRASNGIDGEAATGLDAIGKLLPDGRLTGNFAADPGRVIEVDHLLGANMAYRRELLLQLGGIRGSYPGTCLCEESDIALRVKAAGHRLVYAPSALVRHIAAPYTSGGQRFDHRYAYYAKRNHVVLLVRNFGWSAQILRRYLVTFIRGCRDDAVEVARRIVGREPRGPVGRLGGRASALALLARMGTGSAGLIAGLVAAPGVRRRDRHQGVATP